jgi:hypothetical protein
MLPNTDAAEKAAESSQAKSNRIGGLSDSLKEDYF